MRELVERARGGDRDAQSEIYRRYFERIARYVAARLDDPQEAHDLAQDVLLRALAALADLDANRSFENWLFLIARNRMIDHVRRHGRMHVAQPDAVVRERETRATGEPVAADPGSGLFFLDLIRGLPRREQQVLLLRYGLGLTPREIGDAIGCSYGTVRMIQTRALARLRPCLAPALSG